MLGRKNIYYKSIFKQDGQTETIEYKCQGNVFKQDQYIHIAFESKGNQIDIAYNDKEVILQNNKSKLYFDFHKKIWSNYQLPYGIARLGTRLLVFEVNSDRLKMKYELYDQQGFISTVYILVTMTPLGSPEDINIC